MTFQEYLNRADDRACSAAREWAADKTFKEVYETCRRGDWLCWLFFRTNPGDGQVLTLVKGLQANEVRHHMRNPRSIAAVDAAIAFGFGAISREQLNAAYADADAAYAAADADAAYAAADADAADADAYAAYAAAYAAYAAADADAADADAAAAYAAADAAAYAAADADAYAAAWFESLSRSADIFRENIPYEKINQVWETM